MRAVCLLIFLFHYISVSLVPCLFFFLTPVSTIMTPKEVSPPLLPLEIWKHIHEGGTPCLLYSYVLILNSALRSISLVSLLWGRLAVLAIPGMIWLHDQNNSSSVYAVLLSRSEFIANITQFDVKRILY